MIGKILGNRYEILEKIGDGGMAYVYKARCQLLDRLVAIKVLKPEFTKDEEFIRKFRRESQAAASLSHPNIVNIYDVGVEEGEEPYHYIVMEYIKGKTLKDIIIEKGSLGEEDTIKYTMEIAKALEDAHRNGIIHRDIKPQNIMITEDDRVKVTDFGIARAATSTTMTTTSNVLGSVYYFSPEQARGGYTDEKSDIYSLGIVMYEMITGQLPYKGESPITVALKHIQEDLLPPREINPSMSKRLESIILKSVEKRQVDRYQSIKQLINDLSSISYQASSKVTEERLDENDHTRIIPALDIKEEEDLVKKKKKKKDFKPIILGVLLALFISGGYFFMSSKLKSFKGSEVVVPNIVGKTQEEAEKILKDLGLELKLMGTVKNTDFEPGSVVNQDPLEGIKVKKGYPVQVNLSEAEDGVRVPDLTGMNILQVGQTLSDLGLSLGDVGYRKTEEDKWDLVIEQFPRENTSLAKGEKINIILGEKEEEEKIKMPSFIGKSLDEAKIGIVAIGLELGDVVEEYNDDQAKGKVYWQNYEVGTELEKNTAVDLYVSLGKKEPEEVEEKPEEVEEKPKEEETPMTFTAVLNPDKETTQIKVIRNQDGQQETVYNKKHNLSEGEVSITVKGKKGSSFDIFYDDVYKNTLNKNN